MFQTSPKSYPIFWLVCKKMGRQNLTKVAQSGHTGKTSSECMCGREGGERAETGRGQGDRENCLKNEPK